MKNFIIIILLISSCIFSATFAASKKPPQLVVISFDNCTQIDRWQQLADFLDHINHQHSSIHFTFFLSGTNFLSTAHQNLYQGPHHAAGEAEIPFGGTDEEMKQRIALINKLYLLGNELGSHAIGHFDGEKWSTADWENELIGYQYLFNNIARNNQLADQEKFIFPFSEVQGFRAPYLAVNSNLYQALKSNHYRYDASGIGNATDWPKKEAGLWHFNLARLKIADSNMKTISMDYNFFIAQSKAKSDSNPEHLKRYQQQMFATYMAYFLANYQGHRAPIIIGHHFTNYQNGIYNQSLLAFAEHVCRLPEVRCVSFKELADYLDKLSPTDLENYQKGLF